MERSPRESGNLVSTHGLVGDLHRTRASTAATAEEMREFIREFKGKSPQQVLGLVAQSGLFQGVVVSTIATVVLMAIGTFVPYVWSKNNPPKQQAAAPAAAKAPAAQSAATSAPAAATATEAPNAAKTKTAATADTKVLKALGMDETKSSDPKRNPLENSADDLLKDLK